MRPRRLTAVLVATLPLSACSGAADGTEVLGAVVEVTPQATVTVTPAPPPPPPRTPATTPATASPPAPPASTPAPTHNPAPADAPAPIVTPTPRLAPAPAVAPSPTPTPDVEHLDPGGGWSTNTLLPDEGGEAWTEVSGQAPVAPDGTSEARLFVTLVHDPVPGDSAGRLARCRAWLEAAPGAALRAAGEVTVELLVGGETLRAVTHSLDGLVPAGARVDLPPFERPERVHALGGEAVTCTVAYTPSG